MKTWSDSITQHITHWSARLGALKWWPRFVYHFTDVHNAVNILQTGQLFCRAIAEKQQIIQVDSASPGIIRQTRDDYKNYVRLYFRPRTPTQYRNEGIRPYRARELGGAHCPIPIFFCFDAHSVLAMDETEFSDGSMASPKAVHGKSQALFESIPFQYVFHNSGFPPELRDTIIFHRHAEVLVPNALDLTFLKGIACRSAAERQTFLHLLPNQLSKQWLDKIRISERGFFERKWSFVEEVVVVNEHIIFKFNPPSTQASFDIRVEYLGHGKNKPSQLSGRRTLDEDLKITVRNATFGVVKLYLDDALAFCDRVFFGDIPF